jgi:hypothetical protein
MNGVEIWVRRGGPYEKEGLAAMKTLEAEGFLIHVFDRHTPLTDIVDLSLKKQPSLTAASEAKAGTAKTKSGRAGEARQ